MDVILIILLADVIPIGLWMYYFNEKNPRKQGIKEVLSIFLLGIFSILPVYLFHSYVSTILLARIETWHPFLAQPLVQGGMHLLLILLFTLLFIVLFAFFQAFFIRFTYKLPLKESFRSTSKKLYHITPLFLFLSFFLVLEVGSVFISETTFVLSLAGSTMLFAMLEEYFKYIINPFLVYKRVNSIGNAMVNALYVGLAFAFVENALFFIMNYRDENFIFIFIYRSLVTTLMHVCASGILGYFYGLSLFSESVLTNYEIEKGQYQVPVWLKKMFGMGKNSTFQSTSVTQGFVIAALLHALFNLLLSLDKKLIAAVLVLILVLIVVRLLIHQSTHVQYGLIGSSTMPHEDFEKLRLQISVLQHVKDIQAARLNQPMKPPPPPSSPPLST